MTEGGESVAAWVPPGETDMTPGEEEELLRLTGELLGDRATELEELYEQFDANHPRDVDHYYLGWWGTHRDFAGKGFGSSLIGSNLARIDSEHQPAYLESTNPANLARYEALGFEAVGTFGPPDGPVVTTMWRQAR